MLTGQRKKYFLTKEMYSNKKYTPIMKLEEQVAITAGNKWIIADRIVGRIKYLKQLKDNYYKLIIVDKNDVDYEIQMYKDYDTTIGDVIVVPMGAVTYNNGIDYNQSCLGYEKVDEELSDITLEPNKTLNINSIMDKIIFVDSIDGKYNEEDSKYKDVRFALLKNED